MPDCGEPTPRWRHIISRPDYRNIRGYPEFRDSVLNGDPSRFVVSEDHDRDIGVLAQSMRDYKPDGDLSRLVMTEVIVKLITPPENPPREIAIVEDRKREVISFPEIRQIVAQAE